MPAKKNFTRDDMEGIEKIFNGTDEYRKLQLAAEMLDIDLKKFVAIHTVAAKQKQLKYRYVKKEFEVIEAAVRSNSLNSKKAYLDLLEKAYQIAASSDHINRPNEDYGPDSFGLSEINVRSSYKIAPPQQPEYDMDQSVFVTGKKNTGYEPGYEALQTEDLMLSILENYTDKVERWEYIFDNHANIEHIKEQHKAGLPTYMVKSAYSKLSSSGKVSTDRENIENTNTIKKHKKNAETLIKVTEKIIGSENTKKIGNKIIEGVQLVTSCLIVEKNSDNIREVMANDIIRVYGAHAQKQVINLAEIGDGQLMVMLKSTMLEGVREMNPIAGGNKKNTNYTVQSVVLSAGEISFITRNNIPHLAEITCPLSIQAIRDAWGSNGQNKLEVMIDGVPTLVVIDQGHAYEMDILKSVKWNFHIVHSDYKNYSITYDHPRSDFVRGLIKIAKVKGEVIDEAVLKSYDEIDKPKGGFIGEEVPKSNNDYKFYNTVSALKEDADKRIFQDYSNKFRELAAGYDGEDKISMRNREECLKHAKDILDFEATEETKEPNDLITKAMKMRDAYVARFLLYTRLKAKDVDLIENIEKFLAGPKNTSMLAADGNVMLRRMRIIDEDFLENQLLAVTVDTCSFSVRFKEKKAATEARTRLNQFMISENLESKDLNFKLTGKTLEATMKRDCAALHNSFAEVKLQSAFHPEHYRLLQRFIDESTCIKYCENYKKYNISISLTAVNDKGYELKIQPCVDTVMDFNLFQLLATEIGDYNEIKQDGLDHNVFFSKKQLTTITNLLKTTVEKYEREKKIAQCMENIKLMFPTLSLTRDGNLFDATIIAKPVDKTFKKLLATELAEFVNETLRYRLDHKELFELAQKLKKLYLNYAATIIAEHEIQQQGLARMSIVYDEGKYSLFIMSDDSKLLEFLDQQLPGFKDKFNYYSLTANQLHELPTKLDAAYQQYELYQQQQAQQRLEQQRKLEEQQRQAEERKIAIEKRLQEQQQKAIAMQEAEQQRAIELREAELQLKKERAEQKRLARKKALQQVIASIEVIEKDSVIGKNFFKCRVEDRQLLVTLTKKQQAAPFADLLEKALEKFKTNDCFSIPVREKALNEFNSCVTNGYKTYKLVKEKEQQELLLQRQISEKKEALRNQLLLLSKDSLNRGNSYFQYGRSTLSQMFSNQMTAVSLQQSLKFYLELNANYCLADVKDIKILLEKREGHLNTFDTEKRKGYADEQQHIDTAKGLCDFLIAHLPEHVLVAETDGWEILATGKAFQ